jgi:hypothetical protein
MRASLGRNPRRSDARDAQQPGSELVAEASQQRLALDDILLDLNAER